MTGRTAAIVALWALAWGLLAYTAAVLYLGPDDEVAVTSTSDTARPQGAEEEGRNPRSARHTQPPDRDTSPDVSRGSPRITASPSAAPQGGSAPTRPPKSEPSPPTPDGLDAWLASETARYVVGRESGGDCDVVNPEGPWRGKWQFDDSTWLANGGGRFAPIASAASCREQDLVAYATWKARGWQPWGL